METNSAMIAKDNLKSKKNFLEIKKFIRINNIITINIPDFKCALLTEEDLKLLESFDMIFKITSFNYKITSDIEVLKAIKQKLTFEDKESLIKGFILIISFIVHSKSFLIKNGYQAYMLLASIFKAISICYKNDILCDNSIICLSKYILILSLFNNILEDKSDRTNKTIKDKLLVWQICNFIIGLYESVNDKNFSYLDQIFEFFEIKIIKNCYNIASLSEVKFNLFQTSYFLNLLELANYNQFNSLESMKVSCNIIGIVCKVYKNFFRLSAMKQLVKVIQTVFVNLTNKEPTNIIQKDISSLFTYASFIHEIIKEYISQEAENNILKRGFIMSCQSGVMISPMLYFPKKGYTLVFSFKWMPPDERHNDRFDIINFIEDVHSKSDLRTNELNSLVSLSVYIQNSKLMLYLKGDYDTNFVVKPEINYIVTIIQEDAGFFSKKSKVIYILIIVEYSNKQTTCLPK